VGCHQKKGDMYENSKWFSIGYYKPKGSLEKALCTNKTTSSCVRTTNKLVKNERKAEEMNNGWNPFHQKEKVDNQR